ncbi:kinase-like domain-containing protein [Lipomyces japonicus]|uniref:kinase-like domain-containing protein n=1 Tax=Lipomyces japonicus TaxID=56871 RepID=UPI0034CF1D73
MTTTSYKKNEATTASSSPTPELSPRMPTALLDMLSEKEEIMSVKKPIYRISKTALKKQHETLENLPIATATRQHPKLLHLQTAELGKGATVGSSSLLLSRTTTTSSSSSSSLSSSPANAVRVKRTFSEGSYLTSLSTLSLASAPIAAQNNDQSPSSSIKQYSWRNPKPRSMRRSWSIKDMENNEAEISPASQYLARFGGTPKPVDVPNPDDDGQEVGDYVLGELIGKGGFSKVKKAYTIHHGEEITHAVKIVLKSQHKGSKPDENIQTDLDHELTIWKCISPPHPHILNFLGVHDTPYATFCFMDYSNRGTLFHAIMDSNTNVPFKVKIRWLHELCSALRFLHQDLRIVHRDVKPENCLLHVDHPEKHQTLLDARLVLCDFGMAEFIDVQEDDSNSTSGISSMTSSTTAISGNELDITGSLPYLPPERLIPGASLLPISPSQDIWALGVLTYVLFTGKYPFMHSFFPKLQQQICDGQFDSDHLLANSNSQVVDFTRRCLAVDPLERWEIGDARHHPLFEGLNES